MVAITEDGVEPRQCGAVAVNGLPGTAQTGSDVVGADSRDRRG
jgi:hypothetical protein